MFGRPFVGEVSGGQKDKMGSLLQTLVGEPEHSHPEF